MYIIGSADAVRGFSLAGVRGQIVTSPEQLNRALDVVVADEAVDILLVTEDVADMNRERIDTLVVRGVSPLVVEIPGPSGPSPDRPSLGEVLRRTIGIRI